MKKYTRFLFITAIVWLTCGSYCQLHADNRLSIFDIPLSNGETAHPGMQQRNIPDQVLLNG